MNLLLEQIPYNFGKYDEKSFSIRDTRFPPGARAGKSSSVHLTSCPVRVGETRQQSPGRPETIIHPSG